MPRMFAGERVIPLKNVCALPHFAYRPAYLKVWRWTKYGIRGIKLERQRQGRQILTSVEAVERFLEATQ